MSRTKRQDVAYEIWTDRRTVWINDPSGLIGRFSKNGIDVHVSGACQGDSCVPGPCDRKSWDLFKLKMLQLHSVEVMDEHMPDYLK